jgi:hypothetical protein
MATLGRVLPTRKRKRDARSHGPQPVRLLAACGVMQTTLTLMLWPIAYDALRLQVTMSPMDARALVAGWSDENVRRFKLSLLLDAFYPPLYALLLRRRARAILPPSPMQSCLVGAATLAAAFDTLENALHYRAALSAFAEAPDWALRTSAVAAIAKLVLLAFCVVALMPFSPLMNTLDKTIPYRSLPADVFDRTTV